MTVDTLGHLLALHVPPASAEHRGELERLARSVEVVIDEAVELPGVDQAYTGEHAANAAATHGEAL